LPNSILKKYVRIRLLFTPETPRGYYGFRGIGRLTFVKGNIIYSKKIQRNPKVLRMESFITTVTCVPYNGLNRQTNPLIKK
jgi:hypothetical protein